MKLTVLTQEEADWIDSLNDPMTVTEIYNFMPMIRLGIRNDDGSLIGTVILFNINTLSCKAEFGVHIFKQCNSIAIIEEYKLIKDFLAESFKMLNLNRIYARIHSDNKRCLKNAKQFGFIEEGTEKQSLFACGQYKDIVVMRILKEDIERGVTHG